MGMQQFTVHPLSILVETGKSCSAVYDLADSVEVHALLKVSGVSGTSTPTLAITGQHSIDGSTWTTLTGLTFSVTAVGATAVSSSINAFRYLRFLFDLTGTTPTFTFELVVFVKTRA